LDRFRFLLLLLDPNPHMQTHNEQALYSLSGSICQCESGWNEVESNESRWFGEGVSRPARATSESFEHVSSFLRSPRYSLKVRTARRHLQYVQRNDICLPNIALRHLRSQMVKGEQKLCLSFVYSSSARRDQLLTMHRSLSYR
jgi:hypothetical protein